MNVSTSEYNYTNLYITPILNDTDYRIILTWGEYPADLDSHLVGTYSGNKFEVYYVTRDLAGYTADEYDAVNLDVDDTSSYGPETITVRYDSSFGDCHYFVQDYTNNGTLESKALSNSQAKVIVYKGNDLLGVYTVPTDMGGVYWNVFSIVNGEIIVENTLSYDKPYDIWAANDDYYY